MNIVADSFFKTLADPTRLRVLVLLQQQGELCVCELTHALALSQPKISRHLARLREAGVVAVRRQGLWMYYRIHPNLPDWMQAILSTTAQGVVLQAPYASDAEILGAMPNRPGGACCA